MSTAPAFDPKPVLALLPNLPGVYRMPGEGGVVVISANQGSEKAGFSYFQKSDLSPRIKLMVAQIVGIETTVVRSESEAFLLENNLIRH